MDLSEYQRFVDELVAAAEQNDAVVGLVALGSTAGVTRRPDEFSDHDVWVVTVDGAADILREDYGWLPDAHRIVGHFFETRHGRSVVYDDGHLLELAVFDDSELEVTRANDYRVLYDTGGIAERLEAIAALTAREHASDGTADYSAGSFVTQMLIGLGRYGRGELLSANQLLRELAPVSLVRVLAATTAVADGESRDNLDPRRRFERAYPEIAERLNRALAGQLVGVAETLLDVARQLGDAFPADARPALGAVDRALVRNRAARPATAEVHHVQLAIPNGTEDSVRRFYRDLLGLVEVEKPAALAPRGGCWFRGPSLELHLGVEEPFRAATKAHPAIQVDDIEDLAQRLVAAGHGVRWDDALPGFRRFYTNDPVGNRLEFVGRS